MLFRSDGAAAVAHMGAVRGPGAETDHGAAGTDQGLPPSPSAVLMALLSDDSDTHHSPPTASAVDALAALHLSEADEDNAAAVYHALMADSNSEPSSASSTGNNAAAVYHALMADSNSEPSSASSTGNNTAAVYHALMADSNSEPSSTSSTGNNAAAVYHSLMADSNSEPSSPPSTTAPPSAADVLNTSLGDDSDEVTAPAPGPARTQGRWTAGDFESFDAPEEYASTSG